MTRRPTCGLRLRPPGIFRPIAALIAMLGTAIGLAACSDAPADDASLTIYVSAPLSGPRAADGHDVVDGAELALVDAGGEAGGVEVTVVALDDATPGGWDAAVTGRNARKATEDATTIAYVGELDSGGSRTSIPITNQAGILQVSPGAGAEDLTRDALGSSDIPDVQGGGERTFGRVIPSDRDQGEAAATWMSEEGNATAQFLAGDDDFGAALRSGFEAAPAAPAIVNGDASPDATFDAQDDPFSEQEPGFVPATRGGIYASDALLDDSDRGSLRILRRSCGRPSECPAGGRRPISVVSAAMDPSQLPPQADDFLAEFTDAYDRDPGRYAAYGYEAVAVVLDSIDRADDPLERGAVADAFFATDDRDSILGTYSIDGVGNTTLPTLGAYVIGTSLRPQAEPQPLELP